MVEVEVLSLAPPSMSTFLDLSGLSGRWAFPSCPFSGTLLPHL